MDILCKIRDLQRAVNQFETSFERCYGISLNEGMALCSLSTKEPLCTGELGEQLGLTPSNTSKVIRSMESKGLIERELGERDHRQMYFHLTEAGRTMHGKACCRKAGIPELLEKYIDANN